MRIAMIGTRGVPAQYGGFETAVEEIGSRLAKAGHSIHVYCRNRAQTSKAYQGMTLHNLPAIRKSALETLSHATLSTLHSSFRVRPDIAFIFNVANAPLLPLFKATGTPTAIHVDGLEWKRAKWQGLGGRYFEWAEGFAARRDVSLIADAHAIQAHLSDRYGRSSIMIPYGASRVQASPQKLDALGLAHRKYHLVVARFEPENHVAEIVSGYSQNPHLRYPLVVVGSSPYSYEYTERIHRTAASDSRIQLLGSVWDQELLDALYASASAYLHGHSVGGTNPSLLRAMGACAPIVAHDNEFNREVSGGEARFFANSSDVAAILEEVEEKPEQFEDLAAAGRDSVLGRYNWDTVSEAYGSLAEQMLKRA